MSNLADKIKEALEAGRSGQYAKKTPYERFGFKKNPFRLDIDPNDSLYQVAREDVLLEFALQVGNAIRLFEEDIASPFRHLLAHGLTGSGMSTLARNFDRDWDQIGFHDYETLYTNLSEWRPPLELQEEFGSSESTLETYEEFLNRISLIEKPLIIFIDDLDFTITGTPAIPRIGQFMSDIINRAGHGVIVIGFVNSLTLTVLLEAEQKILAHTFLSFFNPEYFFFPIFSKSEIRKLILQRLKVARSPTEVFSPKAVELLAEYSLGIPKVALNIATACLNELIVQDRNKANFNVVNDVVNQLGYDQAIRLVEAVDRSNDDETTSAITPKRREIIANILGHQLRERYFFPATGMDGLRSSDLAEFFGVNLSTMNYHLKPLVYSSPIPILEARDDAHDARSKIFCLNWNSPIFHAMEIITVYQRLKPEKYHIKPKTILLSRREE